MTDPGPTRWELLGMGTTIAGCLLIPMGLGWLLDELTGTLPIFLMIGLVIGMASAAGYSYKEVQKFFGSADE